MASGSTSSGSGRGPSGGSGSLGRGLISCLHSRNCRANDAPLLMASGSTSVPLLRRGLISCLHSRNCRADDGPLLSDEDLPQAIDKLIAGFYEEACSRLPCDAMPDLLRLLAADVGGSCLGLLDPVSNIILNTLALLPTDAAPAAAASTSTSPPATRISIPDLDLDGLHMAVSRSYHGLLAFLMAYFGCLEKEQAMRYLYRADANLLLAVMLVQHDLYAEEALDPESDRTQAAFEWAATKAGHPSPTTLARLMSIRLQDGHFALLKKLLFSADAQGIPLTVEDVRATHRILHTMMSPVCNASIIHTKRGLVVHVRHMLEARCSETTTFSTTADARTITTTLGWDGTPLSSLQSGVLPDKLQYCLRIATTDGQKHNLKTPCDGGDACEYLQSLKMYLHGIIHNLYIKALKLLPTPSGSLMRSILKAGHCYGCMDPVSNIIVNSIWYNSCGCSLPVSEARDMAEYNDFLDPRCLLRLQVHSLRGLMELAAFADPRFSTPACALEFLCSTKCDIANMLPSSSTESSEKNPFHESAKAAGHNRPLGLGELHRQLLSMPDTRSELLSFITEAQTSGTVLRVDDMTTRISLMWNRNRLSGAQTVQAPQLCAGALRAVSSEREGYEDRRSLFRSKIEELLKEYTTQQFLGSEYKLDTILGVEERNKGYRPIADIHYHVNFTATCDLRLQRTLFFTQFSLCSRKPEPEFCCPLPYANAGRCYYGVHSARKIVYPDDAKYIPDDITFRGTRSADGMLGMDLVYFSPELDVEIAESLNILHSEEEEEKRKKRKRRGMCRS